MSVSPRGMAIQEAYREYRNGNFRVNRRYQRKLVWSLHEKEMLIDSVLSGYPIPLILLAYQLKEDGTKSFEILDGLQRLNAIFTFIENGFAINGKFFDDGQLARAKALADEGAFARAPAELPRLSPLECAKLLEYTLAVTEFPSINEVAVTNVFGRINSFGRQLSDQERRQAGIVSEFANVCREISAEIRGDATSETLDLSEMPEISIDSGGEFSTYAIKADDTFWCRQGIIRKNNLRFSEDEQLVADIVISILNEQPFAFSGTALDAHYDITTEEGKRLNDTLISYSPTRLKHEVVSTISILRSVVEDANPEPGAFRKTVDPGSSNPAKTAFFAVFMAFFDLCVRQRKSPTDSKKIMASLTRLQERLQVAAGQIRSEPRQQNIDTVIGLVGRYFEDKDPPVLHHGVGSSIQFENAIRRSRTESAIFECKQGLVRLDDARAFDSQLLDRILETICGIANSGAREDGGLFIGVADKKSDAERIKSLDSIIPVQLSSRYCVGIDREAQVLKQNVDQYIRKVVGHISSSKLSEPLRTAICSSIEPIVYRGMTILCIWVPPQKAVSYLNDELFIREGSETKKVTNPKAIGAIHQLFSGKSKG